MGLMHLSQSYLPYRFPPSSQEEEMPPKVGYGKNNKKPMKPRKSKKGKK